MSIIEHISFHYSTFPDTLSELVNYYDVDLIKCNGSWYVSDVTSTNDDFDAIYKGSEFTAEKADEIIALRDAHSLNDTSAIEAIMDDYNLSDNSNATLAGNTTWYNYNATNATAYAYTYVSQMFGKSNWSDFDKDAKEAGRSYYNQNFYDWGQDNTDCQNFASQCIWAGFNGSNAVNQIYNASTREYSPIMDNAVLYYPLLSNMYAYDSIEEGFDAVLQYCDALQELQRRDDAADALAARYKNTYSNQNADVLASSAELMHMTYIQMQKHTEKRKIQTLLLIYYLIHLE